LLLSLLGIQTTLNEWRERMREMRLQNERERSVLVVAEDTQEAVS